MKPDTGPGIQLPHYRQPLEDHLAELQEQDVIEDPLQKEEWGTWISRTGGLGNTCRKVPTSTAGPSTKLSTRYMSQYQWWRSWGIC